jgi:hypothetical protein
MHSFTDLDRRGLLADARRRLRLRLPLDVTGELAAQNLQVGIGRLLFALRTINHTADVVFTASPDFTITRSSSRWASGFSYGGLLEISFADQPIVVPEIRPNTCGSIYGELPIDMPLPEIIDRLVAFRSADQSLSWDYSRKNHFVNIYRSHNTQQQVFIIHGCPEALRHDSETGPGLYIDNSPHWQILSTKVETPLGCCSLLFGTAARDYYSNFLRCEILSKQHRSDAASAIFGAFRLLGNETHEGMASPFAYILGCHLASDSERVYPLMTNLGQSAYLISRRPVVEQDASSSLLPHGMGYEIPVGQESPQLMFLNDGTVLHVLSQGSTTEVFRDFSSVPYSYRGLGTLDYWVRNDLFMIRDTLEPLLFTKL